MYILLVDDHQMFREGLRLVLSQTWPDDTIREAQDCEAALNMVSLQKPDLVLLDMMLPGLKTDSAYHALRALLPDSKIIILSGTENTLLTKTLIASGANGFISKSSSTDVLTGAIKSVLAGQTYLADVERSVTPPHGASEKAPIEELTPRQMDVLEVLAEGLSNKDIGQQLDMSENTVRVHLSSIMRLLQVNNRTHAVKKAFMNSILPRSKD